MLKKNSYKILLICMLAAMIFHLSCEEGLSKASVGVYECPPFVAKTENDTYTGISIELWEHVAEQMELEYSIEGFPLKDMLELVASGKLDIGVSCTSITAAREQFIDFSHSFYENHLAIAVKKQGRVAILVNLLTNRVFLTFFLFFFACAFVVGGISYHLEGDRNDKLFSTSSTPKRLTEAFILGLLFVTKGPFQYFHLKTLTGRVLTVLMAIGTTFLIAGITAILASSFTLGMLRSDIQGPNDLNGKKVEAIRGSTSSTFLNKKSIYHHKYETKEALLKALESKKVEAVVADEAILRYMIKKG